MSLQEDRLPCHRIKAGVKDGERRGRPEHIMTVVHHAMRVTIRLGAESLLGFRLMMGAFGPFGLYS